MKVVALVDTRIVSTMDLVSADGREKRRKSLVYQAVLVAISVAIVPTFFGSYAFDDSFIGYAIAKNFLNGRGFVFDPGVNVLSTSAPLAPLIYALVSKMTHADVVDVAQIVAFCGYLALGPAGFAMFRVWTQPIGAFAAALTLVTSPFVVLLWSHESLLCLVFSVVGGALLVRGRLAAAGIAFTVATLMRQEALLFVVLCALALLRTHGRRAAVTFAVVGFSGFALWTAYALATFGTVFSRTMSVKIAMGESGLFYTFAPGLANYMSYAFWKEPFTIHGAFAISAMLVVSLILMRIVNIRIPGPALVILLGSLVECLIYVAIHTAFFAWFCLPVAALIATIVALPWADRTWPHSVIARYSRFAQIATSIVLVGLHLVFAYRITHHGFPKEAFVGPFPGAHFRESGFVRLGKMFDRTLPLDASIYYPEPGQLRYYSNRTLIDSQGLTHPGAVRYYRAGHPEWTIERYRPTIVLEDTVEHYPHASWFSQAYRSDARLYRVGKDATRSLFRIYRLVRPEAIPAPPDRAA